ncbi:MAG: DUF1186 domain-containing protein [Thermoflexales bacterium]|nr:DUF1186 domain-containing protein [Thermoflexales bacterium]
MDYQSLSADQLLAALEEVGRAPDLELIQACLARREELVPGLLDMLAASSNDSWEDEDPRWYRVVHAGLLLIAFREPAALPLFAELLRDRDRKELIEWFSSELPAYGPAAVQMAIDLLDDAGAHGYARSAAAGILTTIAWRHPEERNRILTVLRAHLPPLEDGKFAWLPESREQVWLLTWVVHALAELQDETSRPQVMLLFEHGMIDEFILGDLDDYLAYFQPGAVPWGASHPPDVMETYKWLHQEAAEAAKRKAQAVQRAAESASKPPPSQSQPSSRHTQPQTVSLARPQPQVGRNEPCPCGSGKKYKHCHLAQDR